MAFGVVGEVINTAAAAANPPTIYHLFSMHNFFELKAIRTWVVKYGAPAIGVLGLELRALREDGTPGEVIATSSKTWTLAEISAENYAAKEIWFDWDNPPLLAKDVQYAFNLTLSSYTGDDTNHIAWVHAWPDPIVSFVGSTLYERLSTFPFQVGIIGREVLP